MGNAIRCLEGGGDDHAAAGERYPYYRPTSAPSHIGLQALDTDVPTLPTHRPVLAHHGVAAAAAAVAALDRQYNLDFKPTSMPTASPNYRRLQGSNAALPRTVVIPQSPQKLHSTDQDIDESSAAVLRDAESYAKSNPMLIQVPVLGTSGRTFWRLSDDAARISRKLALILRNHHAAGKHLAAPLKLSSVWIGSSSSAGSVVCVKLRGVQFVSGIAGKRSGQKHMRKDYKGLARVLRKLIGVSSGGGVEKMLPPDYKEFLALLVRGDIKRKDEFLIVNNPALLPMSNRTEVFLMLYDKIVTTLVRTQAGQNKATRILSKLPYEQDWLATAEANTQINKWVQGVKNKYTWTQLDQLRLNRNVRSHLHEYNDENVEEILYCEWPLLITEMAKLLHQEGELQRTGIHNKFGC